MWCDDQQTLLGEIRVAQDMQRSLWRNFAKTTA
jgi:hypothetical protein